MPVTADTSAPYCPKGQISDIISRYREKGSPTIFNLESLGRIGVPDSLSARTLQALKILDLVEDDGKPTKTFEAIRLASSDSYQDICQQWLRAAYADVFSIVDAADDETKIRDAFRTYTPPGQQDRMVNLFIGLCEAAGLRSPSSKSSSGESKPKMKRANTGAKISKTSSVKKAKQSKNEGQKLNLNTGNLPAPISGLLASLPNDGGIWTQSQRDKFYKIFGATLDFCYEIGEPEQEEDESSEENT